MKNQKMKNRGYINLKKIFIFILLSLFSDGVYANGEIENGKITIKDNTTGKTYLFSATTRLKIGSYEIKVNALDKSKRIEYVIIKKDENWYNTDGEKIEIDDIITQLTAGSNKQPGEIEIKSSISNGIEVVALVDTSATTSIGQFSLTEAQKQEMKNIEIKDGVPVLRGTLDGKKHNYSVYFLYNNNSFQQIDFVAETAFFKNETAVLDALCPGNLDYKTKALAFFSLYFDDYTKFTAMAKDYFNVTLPPRDILISRLSAEAIIQEGMKDFRLSFGLHFSNLAYENVTLHDPPRNGGGLPYLVVNDKLFDSIYSMNQNTNSAISPNIYISAYLIYSCEIAQKPLLSYFYRESLPDKVSYDFSKFKKYTIEDGNRLAKAALRYLTWGVEYTPYSAAGIATGVSNKKVFNTNFDMIYNWVIDKNNEANRTAESNFLPTSVGVSNIALDTQKINSQINKIHVLDGDWYGKQYTFIGNMNGNIPMNISRIDLWSSNNIAWEENRINQVIINDVAYDPAFFTKLFDKKIYPESSSSNNNLLISKPEDPNKKLTLGYKFKNMEEIGALLLIRGKTDAIIDNKKKLIEKKIVIKYKDAQSAYKAIEFKKNQNNYANCSKSVENIIKKNAETITTVYAVDKEKTVNANSPFWAYDNNYTRFWRSNTISNPTAVRFKTRIK